MTQGETKDGLMCFVICSAFGNEGRNGGGGEGGKGEGKMGKRRSTQNYSAESWLARVHIDWYCMLADFSGFFLSYFWWVPSIATVIVSRQRLLSEEEAIDHTVFSIWSISHQPILLFRRGYNSSHGVHWTRIHRNCCTACFLWWEKEVISNFDPLPNLNATYLARVGHIGFYSSLGQWPLGRGGH